MSGYLINHELHVCRTLKMFIFYSLLWFCCSAESVRAKTPPVSISDLKKVRASLLVQSCCLRTKWNRWCFNSLRRRRWRYPRVLECLSSWATLSTLRPSTRRIWGKRWSSWCWTRRTASRLLMVGLFDTLVDWIFGWMTDFVFGSTQILPQTGRRSSSRSCRSTKSWRSRTTRTTSGTRRSRRCSRPTTARNRRRFVDPKRIGIDQQHSSGTGILAAPWTDVEQVVAAPTILVKFCFLNWFHPLLPLLLLLGEDSRGRSSTKWVCLLSDVIFVSAAASLYRRVVNRRHGFDKTDFRTQARWMNSSENVTFMSFLCCKNTSSSVPPSLINNINIKMLCFKYPAEKSLTWTRCC